ncbi:MAG: IclR family transcriptional regulator [Acidobacteria bacterium]|nr:IclR family transcriptional regulator [Acidobacteriota bacterium]
MSLKQTAKQTSPRTKRNLKNDYAAPALDKGLDVIELLAHQTVGLSMSQIARELNRSVSEIFRMLLCLEHRGYIAQAGAEKYFLTLKLFKLVQEHPPTERLISEALPVMHRLASQTMQSCHLGVVESGRVVILAQVNAPTSVGFYVKLGSTVDIMEASSGYVILAHQNKAEQERTLTEWQRETGRKPPKNLEAHLALIQKKGFEKRESYQVRGVVNFSFPVLDHTGSAIAAITIPYIDHMDAHISPASITEMLRAGTQEVSKAIGLHV